MITTATADFIDANGVQHLNDIFVDDAHNLAMLQDKPACAQVITNALRTQMGELQYDLQKGIPYFETIFARRTNVKLWQAYMMEEIERIDHVVNVETFDITYSDNSTILHYESRINTDFGDLIING